MAYTRDEVKETHVDYDSQVGNWEYYIRSYNGGNDYAAGEYLNRYNLELGSEYSSRITNTPCDNHCKNIIQIYSSFLFRVKPTRFFESMSEEASLDSFLKDADLEGNSFNNVIKQAQNYSAIYGHVLIMLDKPSVQTGTRAEELDQDIRPYVSIITPENIYDWNYTRSINGKYELDYLKIREEVDKFGGQYFKLWYPDRIDTVYLESDNKEPELVDSVPNRIGKIPAVILYNAKSAMRGIGLSDLSDIADLQKSIYNDYSEIEQLIRLSNHPSLVKTPSTNASAGAGAIIEIPDELEPNLKPYLLQPSGSSLTSIMDSISGKVESINRIAHTGAIRATKTQVSSGIALQTEFELLNARLSEKAANLEIAEENIWRLYASFQNVKFDGEISYPDSFNIRDYATDLAFYQQAKAIQVPSPTLDKEINKEIARSIVDNDSEILDTVFDEIDNAETVGSFTEEDIVDKEVEQEVIV